MQILKEHLGILWYEDEHGNKLPADTGNQYVRPKGARYQVSQSPTLFRTIYVWLARQEEVDKCKHPRKSIAPTHGWVEGIVGRKCHLCGGRQTKKRFAFWPRKWDGSGSYETFSAGSSWSEDLVLAIVNSSDYTLSEAITIAARSCERCMNSLAHKYGLVWGYPEYSEEWRQCSTVCQFCEKEVQKDIKI